MMKTISRISQLAAMACVLLPLAVACVGGVDGDGDTDGGVDPVGDCDVDTDCAGEDFCHAYLKTCVANCVVDTAACGDDTPICNEEDANGVRPFDNADYNNVCVCDDTSCAAGQVCSPDYGVCLDTCDATDAAACATDEACYAIGADNFCQPSCTADTDCGTDAPICDTTTGQCLQGCSATDGLRVECGVDELCDVLAGTCFGACTEPGAQDSCAAGELCVADGTCEDECDDDLCLNSTELCHTDVVAATFNQCVALDVENDIDTVTCPSVTYLDDRDTDGPVIYALDTEIVVDDTDICDAGQDSVFFSVLYVDATGDVDISELAADYGVRFQVGCDDCTGAGIGGTVGLYFPQGGGKVTYDGDASSGEFTMYNCYDNAPSNLAVQMIDLAGNFSNSVCYVE